MDTAPRKVQLPDGDLTLLFSDIEGSTKLLQEIGDLYGDVLARHHEVLREVWPAHGGVEIHADGDSFLVAFREARAALRAAAAAQDALHATEWPHGGPLRVRMGIHTGNVQIRHDDYWGIDVHYAARLANAAHGGQVLLSATTRALVPDAPAEGLGEHALKDFPAPRPIYHLVHAGRRSADFPPPRTLQTVRSNLPSVTTRLVGREHELEALRERLDGGARLITITGVGGSGKTRLAVDCGMALIESFREGVFLVGLASVTDADKVAYAIADAIGAPSDDGRGPDALLTEYVARRELLLILDNMEHLLAAASLMPRLLEAAPGLRIVATSQAPLRVRGEVVMPLDSLERDAAVALFAERARDADPSFELTEDNTAAIDELCRRLDGLPLALELAAARVRLGGPERLLAGLERGIDALGSGARDLPERQRGLRAALDWTVSLLGEQERLMFAGLGVFAEAWTLEQLDRLFGGELDVWEASASLLDFSLIRTRGDGRFTMAEAVRTYARALLDVDAGKAADYRRRHAEMLTEEAESIYYEALLDLSTQIPRTRDLMREFAAALEWSAAHDPAIYRRLLAAIGPGYYVTGQLPVVADDLIALAERDQEHDVVSARILLSSSLVRGSRADNARAAHAARSATARAREAGDERGEALGLLREAHMLPFLADPDVGYGNELLAAASRLGAVREDPRLQRLVDGETAIILFVAGDLDRAAAIFQEIVDAPDRHDWVSNFARSYLGDCALRRGRFAEAISHYADTVRGLRGTQLHNLLIQCDSVAYALAGMGRDVEALELAAASEAVGEREGAAGLSVEEAASVLGVGDLVAAARSRLDDAEVAEAEARGRAYSLDDLISRVSALATPVGVA